MRERVNFRVIPLPKLCRNGKPPCLTVRARFWSYSHTRAFGVFILILYVDGSEKPPRGKHPRRQSEAIKVCHSTPPQAVYKEQLFQPFLVC